MKMQNNITTKTINQNKMKQTAIEWLIDQIDNKDMGEIPMWVYDFCYDAKEMEKEQMIDFAEFVATYPDKNKNVHGDMLHAKSKYDGAERTIDLLETFKGK